MDDVTVPTKCWQEKVRSQMLFIVSAAYSVVLTLTSFPGNAGQRASDTPGGA